MFLFQADILFFLLSFLYTGYSITSCACALSWNLERFSQNTIGYLKNLWTNIVSDCTHLYAFIYVF